MCKVTYTEGVCSLWILEPRFLITLVTDMIEIINDINDTRKTILKVLS